MADNTDVKKKQLEELEQRRKKILGMGGPDRVETQKKKGKLTARERIDTLLDEGTFQESGMFAKSRGAVTDIAADGVITGYGKVNGRKVYLYSQDFTSSGGTLAEVHAEKIANILDAALKSGCPVIWK